ncbi:MAG: hypothetical protein MUC96_35565 [Myxococcaceae bacterium]|jgi:hypothetical protein|nr:hypothetical protein [Myxococcaceae bacterium]
MSVSSDVEVANQALGYVGQRAGITSLLEDSTEARAVRNVYATAKRKLLEDSEWRWATARQQLALVSGATRQGWAYVHAAPSSLLSADCARYIEDGGRPTPGRERVPFRVELNDVGNGFVVVSDVERPTLVFTRDVPVALWPSVAIDALAFDLAARLALVLPVKPQVGLAMASTARQKLMEARAGNLTGDEDDQPPDAEWVRGRGLRTTWRR